MTVLVEVFLHVFLLDDNVLLQELAPLLLPRGWQTLPLVEKLSCLFFISFIVMCLGGIVGELGCRLWDEVRVSILQVLLILWDCVVNHHGV